MLKVCGGCHCGAIRFEAEVDPARATLCHCTDCQNLSGGPYRATVPAAATGFRLLNGEPRTYIKTADSGAKRRHAFCGDCGAPIFATSMETPQSYSLRLGTLDQRREITPKRQIWRRSALAWCDDLSAVPTDPQS
jgi:hypothetical protein